MNALQAKLKEVSQSLLPVVIYVILMTLIFVPVEQAVILRFLLGAALLFLGLAVFLWGVDQSMEPIGVHMAQVVAHSGKLIFALLFAFLLGFLITIAEPDLLILGGQIQDASGGALQARFLVIIISAGVGLMIALGALRILFSKSLRIMMALVYGLIAVLGIFTSSEFLAIAFDASGATTGALTTPFILALSLSLSNIKGGRAEDDSFGLVGIMSSGPILAVALLSIVTGQGQIRGEAQNIVAVQGIWEPFLAGFMPTLKESLLALAPLALLFYLLNALRFKLGKRELLGISRGLIYTLLGLTLFLLGANTGFMEMGRLLGQGLSRDYSGFLIVSGFLLGFIVVAAEPAVHVLGESVEDVTAGHIPAHMIRLTLSIGVGVALALSMLRITIPEIELWYFLLPGFLLAILLSFYVEDLFVGIAYDAGGVASGPMAATFVLAFTQGIAGEWPTADVLRDGFGVIALIAMTPVLSIMILGALYKRKQKRRIPGEEKRGVPMEALLEPVRETEEHRDLVVITIDHGTAGPVIEQAREIGAYGATVLHARDERGRSWAKYTLDFDPERDVIWFLLRSEGTDAFCQKLWEKLGKQLLSLYVIPAESSAGLETAGSTQDQIGEKE